MARYHVEVRPEGSEIVLYLTQLYRMGHDGPYTDSYKNRLTWEKIEFAERRIETDKAREPGRVHGPMIYRIVEEPLE